MLMKRFFIFLFAGLLFGCSQTKIAYIDIEVLMSEYEATKEMEALFTQRQEMVSKKLDSLQAPFQQKVQDYYANADKMSTTKRSETEQALQQEQQYLQSRQQQASQELQLENQQSSEVLTKRVDSIVEIYAKSKNLDLIVGTSGKGTVLYGDENLDITQEILSILNSEYNK